MGLWDWFIDALTGQTDPKKVGSGSHSTDRGGGSSVATLEGGEPEFPDQETADGCWWELEGASITEPVGPQRPEMHTEALALENLLVSHFDGHDLTLPPLPRIPQEVLQKLKKSNCDFGEVTSIISEGQVISAAVLRIANSPLYRGLEKMTALRAAINRLGAGALKTLMMHQSLKAAMFQNKGGDQARAKELWRRALASGCIMTWMSKLLGTDPEEAFLTGLLHDIGNVMVLRIVNGQEILTKRKVSEEEFEHLCFECHQEFGELIADDWKLPAQLRDVIIDHHGEVKDDDPFRRDKLQVQLTDMIIALLGFAPQVAYNLIESRPARELGLSGRDEFVTFLKELEAQLDDTMSYL